MSLPIRPSIVDRFLIILQQIRATFGANADHHYPLLLSPLVEPETCGGIVRDKKSAQFENSIIFHGFSKTKRLFRESLGPPDLALIMRGYTGIPHDCSANITHTLTEASALVSWVEARASSQANRIVRVGVAAPALHLLRAFVTTVSVYLKEKAKKSSSFPEIHFFPLVPQALDWGGRVVHSQGVVAGTRSELLDGELDRLWRYTMEKNDLVNPEEILNYIKFGRQVPLDKKLEL